MARLIGYMANRVDGLLPALHQEREVVAPPSAEAAAGWGIGFYQGDEVLHRKRPRLDTNGFDWEDVAGNVKSDCVVIHWRRPTVGSFRADNTHPFRMRSWVFAHNGTLERFDAVRERLLESIPDFLQRNIRGDTDSELVFHVMLSFLHDAGQLDNVDADPKTVLAAIRSTVSLVDRLSEEVKAPVPTLNSVLTNGRSLFALRRGGPLMVTERQGIHDHSAPAGTAAAASPAGLRYVMVASDGREVPRGWREVQEGTVLVVDHDLEVSSSSL
jgi:glutamine amidotransferase